MSIPHPLPHLTNEEKLEIKRYSGQLSCAECRRLKVKCNRKVPCSSCVRRGCSKICPNGTMAANRVFRGPRTSDNAHLYNKIEEMSRRINDLEVSLSLLQARVSSEIHPLLQGDLVKIKYTADICPPESDNVMEVPSSDLPSELEVGLGTLTIGEHGDATYFGRSGGSETLFTAGEELDDATQTVSEYFFPCPDVAKLSNMFPLGETGAWDVPRTLNLLTSFLPARARASALCEVYLEQGCLTGRPIWRPELIHEVVTPIYQHYKKIKDPDFDNTAIPHDVTPHKVAVLYLVFCLGALTDLTNPAYSAEAHHYFDLGRASLSLLSIFDSTEIWTVQALLIMANIHTYGGPHFSPEKAWCLIALTCKLAHKIGLHRESPRWNLNPRVLQRRRTLFWELFGLDIYFSLHTGRPPTFRLSYIDCQLPSIETSGDSPQEQDFIFRSPVSNTLKVMTIVADATLTTNIPRYQTILDLDKSTRETIHAMHMETAAYSDPADDFVSPAQYIRLQTLLLVPAITLVHIHRSFFAQALLEHPEDPLASLYAPSFLAAFQSASGMIAFCVKCLSRFQELFMRWWIVWNSLFTSAILVGSIVIHAPQMNVAPKALAELNLAVDWFEKGAAYSTRARSGLVVLKKLQLRARKAISKFQEGGIMPFTEDMVESSISDFGDELKIFAGHTNVMISKHAPKSECQKMKGSPRQDSPNASDTPPPYQPLAFGSGGNPPSLADIAQQVQPAVQPTMLPQQWPQMQFLPVGAHESPHASLQTSMYGHQQYPSTDYPLGGQPTTRGASETAGGFNVPAMANDQYRTGEFLTEQRPSYNYYDQVTSADLGMGMVGETMDARWMSFVFDSGILYSDAQGGADQPIGL
ncbi:hypothetical protein M378DRAFT_124945 [Amanita muscaria Koide BX008]|uniref:Zn(2)-C6 fungal-type domain-containing protein n=1 Tax=Amanita muscaria (strain Koide BX008) TaxID=946122 RepID=A0A0C2WVW2_AMAMK|nr:hypothetical protein M378DRAFT_124945 [Amanita muscaria Koide BX008]